MGKQFEVKHFVILGALLVAVGTQLAGLEHGWKDAATPAFLGGLLMQVGTTIAAVFVGAPQNVPKTPPPAP